MSRGLKAYIAVVVLAAVAVAGLTLVGQPASLGGARAWSGVLALAGLMVVGEGLGMRTAEGRALFSISLIPTVAMVPLFGPAVAVVSTALSQAVAKTLIQRQPLAKALFNVSQLTLAIGLGALVYVSLGGPISHQQIEVWRTVPPLGGLIVTYFVTNMALVGIVIGLDAGNRVLDIWRELGPVAFANELASSSFSLFVVFAFAELGVGGLFVVLLPLFFVHHAYGVQFKLFKQNKEILELLVKTIEAKDPYTSGHSLRVAAFSRELAEALGMSSRKAEEVETAGLLHDIGKIDFAFAELISSPAKLSEAERALIRAHPERGERLLSSVSSLSETVLLAVRHHHEHYDGSGYPDGLAGEAIPFVARVLMVVDTVDAMLSDRPYRAALTPGQVTAELRRFSGQQFDPQVAAKFIELGMVERAARRAMMDRTPAPVLGMVSGRQRTA